MTADIARLRRLAPAPRRRLALAICLGSLALGSSVGVMAVSAWLISRAAQHPPVLELTVAVVCVRGLAIGRAVFRYLERLVSHDLAFRRLAELRVAVARRLEPLAPAGLAAFRRGELLTTLVADVDAQQDQQLRVVEPIAVGALVATASVAVTAWLLPAAGLVLCAALALAATVPPLVTALGTRAANRDLAAQRARQSALVVEGLRAAPDLTACGAADAWLRRIDLLDADLARTTKRIGRATGLGAGLCTVLGGLAVWAIALVAVPSVRSGVTPGVQLAVLLLLPIAAWEVVGALAPAVSARARVQASARRLAVVLDAPVPVRDPVQPRDLDGPPDRIAVRHLAAHWPVAPDARDDERPRGIEDVDLDLAPGWRVAVVGQTGAGKTTLVAALLRQVEVADGSYLVDGVDARAAAGDDVRAAFGHVSADAHVFDSTLRENLRFARPGAGDGELWDALRAARLAAWVTRLPDGLDTFVGERGARMSAGERVRLSLARALLSQRPVLLLDEPTAGLDPETADALTAELLAARGDRSVLLVTHRLTGLSGVDEIVVLDSGRVVQRGAPDAVLAG
jgi:thiol reductant ABC exporter CydC subunit